MKKYEDVVFFHGDLANKVLNILDTEGKHAALEYLKQWHYPGEHDTRDELPHGTKDDIYRENDYIMSYNCRMGYIGLVYEVNE